MRRSLRERTGGTAVAALLVAFTVSPSGVWAQDEEAPGPFDRVEPDLSDVVKAENDGPVWAQVLGKALFWDTAIGSEGEACASCHFSAGVDHRLRNQINPGNEQLPEDEDDLPILEFGPIGPNEEVIPEDFPLHLLEDTTDRNSPIIRTTDDRLSSSGTFDAPFLALAEGDIDECGPASADLFHADGLPARQVEPRNTPTTINAVFNHRNFWDGRANNIFNGKDVFGRRDILMNPAARVLVYQDGEASLMPMEIEDASLASQAVGPPLSRVEMSCFDRTFADVGRKILAKGRVPLGNQVVHPDDSMFGKPGLARFTERPPSKPLRDGSGYGLRVSYPEMVKRTFLRKYWGAPGKYIITPEGELIEDENGYTQMELNFSLFFGIAVMEYEATLISNQSRFDDASPVPGCLIAADGCEDNGGPIPGVLTEKELDGALLFRSNAFGPLGELGARCTGCHGGPLLSIAVQTAAAPLETPVIRFPETVPPEEDPAGETVATYHDAGFFSVGVTPVVDDQGVGFVDLHGLPLSLAAQFKQGLISGSTNDDGTVNPDTEQFIDGDLVALADIVSLRDPTNLPQTGEAAADSEILRIEGTFKTPQLRNVGLTPPYFHNGGNKNLTELIELYARGGNRRDIEGALGDDSGSGPTGDGPIPFEGPNHGRNVDDNVRPLNLAIGGTNSETGEEKDQEYGKEALVDFMLTLTDPRVQCDEAPFDHPSLEIFNGHDPIDTDGDGKADDIVIVLPAVGAGGYEADDLRKLCLPNTGSLFDMQARLVEDLR